MKFFAKVIIREHGLSRRAYVFLEPKATVLRRTCLAFGFSRVCLHNVNSFAISRSGYRAVQHMYRRCKQKFSRDIL